MTHARPALVALVALVALSAPTVACLGPDLGFEGSGGAGGGAGGGAATTTGTGGADATTSTSTSTTSTTSTTAAGGGCATADDCPETGEPCMAPVCEAATCGAAPAPLGAPCDLAGSLDGVCNALGSCVECNGDEQCGPAETCDEDAGVCEPGCSNGEHDGDETDVDCGGSCEASCAPGAGCLTGTDCESNVCESASTCADGTVAFVTAIDVRPDFGGALAGDALCQQFADAAGLSGTFMAWLSDSTTSPSDRFTQPVTPYRRIDGVVIAEGWAELTSGILRAGIDIDEAGDAKPFAEVWTATDPFGLPLPDSCLDWTSQEETFTGHAGLTSSPDERWTTVYTQFCNRTGVRLYCFQQ